MDGFVPEEGHVTNGAVDYPGENFFTQPSEESIPLLYYPPAVCGESNISNNFERSPQQLDSLVNSLELALSEAKTNEERAKIHQLLGKKGMPTDPCIIFLK